MRQPVHSGFYDIAAVHTWEGLSLYLGGIGIPKTRQALESLGRRTGLPFHGGRVRGKGVYFTREDIDEWIRHLSGVDLDTWLHQLEKDQRGGIVAIRKPRELNKPGRSRVYRFKPTNLYAIVGPFGRSHDRWPDLTDPRHGGEEVCRTDTGHLLATRTAYDAEQWCAMGYLEARCWLWRYSRCRPSTEGDLHMPLKKNRRRLATKATTLIGAVYPDGTRQRWCHVPGTWFELGKDTETPFVATKRLPKFPEARDYIEARYKDVIWLTWSRRVPIDPVSLEPAEESILEQQLERYPDEDLFR